MRIVLALLAAALIVLGPRAAFAGDAPIRTVVYRYTTDERGPGGSSGTIRVDVIAAANDGGLVVDVTQSGDRDARALPKVRCAVYGTTQDIIYDKSMSLTGAERTLLSYMGRGFYDPSRVTDGRFRVEPKRLAHGMTQVSDYTVTASRDASVDLAVVRKDSEPGYAATTRGEITYDADKSVPLHISVVVSDTESGASGGMKIELALVSDSMGAAPAKPNQ